MASARTLYRLQITDQVLTDGRTRLKEIEERLAGDEELQALQRLVGSLTAQASSSRTRVRDSELESQSLSARITAAQDRLYGGRVTNPRELTSLQNEVSSLKRRQRRLEDRTLESMIQLDGLEEQLRVQQSRLGQMTARWEAEQTSLQDEQAELEARMKHLQAERSAVRRTIQPADLSLYEDLRRRRKGLAVVPLEGQACGGCGVLLPSSTAQQIRQTDTLHFCHSCGRILCSQ